MSGIVQKAMGPLMMAIGFGGAPFTGGASLAAVPGGLSQTLGPGGALGQNPAAPQLTPTPSGYTSAAPIGTPSLASLMPQAGGGAIAPTAYAGPTAQDQQIAQNIMQNSPFAAFDPGGYSAAA